LVAEPAETLMTVDEFLRWDDGTDTRYELIDGQIVAMTPPSGQHGTIVMNAGTLINNRLQHRMPCRAQGEAGIVTSDHRRWQAGIAVTCKPPAPDVVDPLLVVEVLSPSTRAKDLARKLPDYKGLPSVRQIWLVDSERRWAQVWWRDGESWHGRDHLGSTAFASEVLEGQVVLDELYANAGL
jgi:Uma2 family endonuclease